MQVKLAHLRLDVIPSLSRSVRVWRLARCGLGYARRLTDPAPGLADGRGLANPQTGQLIPHSHRPVQIPGLRHRFQQIIKRQNIAVLDRLGDRPQVALVFHFQRVQLRWHARCLRHGRNHPRIFQFLFHRKRRIQISILREPLHQRIERQHIIILDGLGNGQHIALVLRFQRIEHRRRRSRRHTPRLHHYWCQTVPTAAARMTKC